MGLSCRTRRLVMLLLYTLLASMSCKTRSEITVEQTLDILPPDNMLKEPILKNIEYVEELSLDDYHIDGSYKNMFSIPSEGNPFSAEEAAGNPPRYLVLIMARFGLANRLRAMADWYAVALRSQRRMLVAWRPTNECNATFSDLFDTAAVQTQLPGLHVLSPLQTQALYSSLNAARGSRSDFLHDAVAVATVRDLAQQARLSSAELPWPQQFFISLAPFTHEDSPAVLVTTFHGVQVLDDMPCQDYLSQRSHFLRQLTPMRALRQTVERYRAEYFPAASDLAEPTVMVGVHYRAHNAEEDWEVVPPASEGGKAVTFDASAPLPEFEYSMRQLLTHNPRIRFLFASNNAAAKDRMIQLFGDKVVVLRGPHERSSVTGMQLAMIEWYFLAQSDLVLHTHGSTFAEEAAQMRGNVPLVSILHGQLVLTAQPSLPYCGLLHYMGRDAPGGTTQVYEEGTTDHRRIRNKFFRFQPCAAFSAHWGLNDVYCALSGEDEAA